ncbi:MAG: class I SAM-dependent methyltransferase [Planctomycetota bacterium]|jgi:2-polyprenyl-3-methyl-5-hydroxy-6-metoxy-1,4-benzoquinol methylase
MSQKPDGLVEKGYDVIARAYHEQRDGFDTRDLLEGFTSLLPQGGAVLDAGCGAGVPVARTLADSGFGVTGIDLSASMLELARAHVPGATFFKMDMRRLEFDAASFDGICAFYSLIHVPRGDHASVLLNFHRMLKPGGILLFSSGNDAWEGTEEFHGTLMYWSHPDPETTKICVRAAGFDIAMSEIREIRGERHLWVLARKNHPPP